MEKKVILPEDINYCGASADWMEFDSIKKAVKMIDFCRENSIKTEIAICKAFPKQDKDVISIRLKNADMCPYTLECFSANENEGFDGVIVSINI